MNYSPAYKFNPLYDYQKGVTKWRREFFKGDSVFFSPPSTEAGQDTNTPTSQSSSRPNGQPVSQSTTQPTTKSTPRSPTKSVGQTVDRSVILGRPKAFYITEKQDRDLDAIVEKLAKKLEGKINQKIDRSTVIRLLIEASELPSDETVNRLASLLVSRLISQLTG